MNLFFSAQTSKETVFASINQELLSHGFNIVNSEMRPWGGFFVIQEDQAEKFIEKYFPSLDANDLLAENKLSPKILIVEPSKRLSWQYHHRRAEIWKVIGGKAGVIRSESDLENAVEEFNTGDILELKREERHRLVGLEDWGIISEIWQHTDSDHPSDEEDIVRLNDDFGR